ncbi:MAG: HEAT repeat domain-containing protein [Spirochaetes bacterium]|nr:HEAT repeat domain-containing protein [Spirochaetota bacterium]
MPLFELNLGKLMVIFIFLSFCMACATTPRGSESQQNISVIIEGLKDKLIGVTPQGRPMRLAVLAFVSTRQDEKSEFGIYFAETLISALKEEEQKFKLFERNRLDVILKENAMTLSGMIDEKTAKRIGELAPIDAILSGTFTKLKNYIDVNGRLIDVVTGEILLTYSASIELTDDLKVLFEKDQQLPGGEKDKCAEEKTQIDTFLSDLSTPDRIKSLVEKAMNIPYDLECGYIHLDVMRAFTKYKIENPDYTDFLMKEVAAIEYPYKDFRANHVLRFLARDGQINEKEWKFGLEIIKKSDARTVSSYLATLLNINPLPDDLALTFKRIDEYFSLVKKQQIGLPVPLTLNTAFLEMIDAFNYVYAKDNRVLIYCYQKYNKDLDRVPLMDDKIDNLLTLMYFREEDEKRKEKILDWICESYNQRQASEKLADDMWDFVKRFIITSYMEKHPEELAKVPRKHLKKMARVCQEQFCKAFPLTRYENQKKERIDFCLENGINCAGFIPGIKECITMLSSKDWNERVRGMDLLEKMKEQARPAEKHVIKALSKKSLSHESQSSSLHKSAAMVLGNIKTKDPQGLELLIKSLGSLYIYVPDEAMKALAKIGKPAVPYLIKALDSEHGSVQYKAAKALGMMGKQAKQAVPALKKLLKSSDYSIRTVAEQAIEEISE